MPKKLDFCKLKNRTAELERCKLPKTCYQTCELVEGANAGSYRRAANFGGGENVQNQGMGAFTGTNPNWNTQPWLGNAQGAVVASTGAGHFFDRSAGRAARERISHEAYIYIPDAHVEAVDEIRFLSLGEQFSQVRISPAGGNLNAASFVGQVNYLGPPNTRQIGGVISVNQNEVYGVLNYVIDRQDNADTRIQYRTGGGAWVNMPISWLYPNLADAQAAQSLDIIWCVQGGIGTNEDDDRRLTETEIQNLGVSSEVVDCALEPLVQAEFDAIDDKLESMTQAVYRYAPPAEDGFRARFWNTTAGPHLDPLEWTGPADYNGFPLPVAIAPDFDVINNDANVNDSGSGAGAARYGIIDGWVQVPAGAMFMRDANTNTGELGMVLIGDCCGNLAEGAGGNHDVNTGTADRTLLDPVPVTAGEWVYIYSPQSDLSAAQGLQLQFSTGDDTGPWVNAEGKRPDIPVVEALEVPICDPIPDGYSLIPPKDICQPMYSASAEESTDEQTLSTTEVGGVTTEMTISDGNTVSINHPATPVIPDQEICTGNFIDSSARTGWLFPWTPTATANTGTVVEDWVQVSAVEVSPDCITDMTVNVSLGNSYIQARNAYARVWYDVRLLVNGVATTTYTFQNYHYEDDIGNTNLDDDIMPMGSAHFSRASVPAGADITVEVRRRYNFVMGSAAVAAPTAREIGGLRSHFNVHYSPIAIVTGRQ